MTPEEKARQKTREQIDRKLEAAGRVLQDMGLLMADGVGVAVRDDPTDTGPVDDVLFVNREACGVIDAKRNATGQNLRFTDEAERTAPVRYPHGPRKARA